MKIGLSQYIKGVFRLGKRKCKEDYHHIFYQKKHYKNYWAKALREHPYCGAYIPQNALHRVIHSKIHDIPTPNSADCKRAVEALDNWLEAGYISLDDSLDKKIEMVTKCFRALCPATTAMLDWQRQIVTKFYKGG